MKKLLYIFLLAAAFVKAQTLVPPPQVLNSAGGTTKVNGNYYGYNIGEPIVGTSNTGANYYTQGFLQPDYKIGTAFNACIYSFNETCQGANDGLITATAYNGVGPVTYQLTGYPADTISVIANIPPGTYTLTVTDSIGKSISQTISIAASSETCPVTIHHAFSPNADGLNDTYIIDGIENYKGNKVFFFNRWGMLVWNHNDYDNVKVVWDGKDNGGIALTAGTYFYVIELPGHAAKKGWVEITK